MPAEPAPNRHQMRFSPDGLLNHDDPWVLRSESYPTEDFEDALTTVFSVGNGAIGLRTAPLGATVNRGIDLYPAIVNGFYETWPIHYPETAYGFATTGQTLLASPNPTHLEIAVDGVELTQESATLVYYERALDMGQALTTERTTWRHADGSSIIVSIERFVSFASSDLVAMRAQVEVSGDPVVVTFRARTSTGRQLDMGGDLDDPRRSRNLPPGSVSPVVVAAERDDRFTLALRTAQSALSFAMVSRYHLPPDFAIFEDEVVATTSTTASAETPAIFERFTAIVLDESGETVSPAIDQAHSIIDDVDYGRARNAHCERVEALWQAADIVVDTTSTEQQAIRFSVFQLLCSGACTTTGIPAKGVSSNGYEGHFFWDTEMFMVPFWHHVEPQRARHLLGVRYDQLPIARAWAQHLRFGGALFAWRTINGHEASAYFPAGTAQFHLNADIAFAVDRFLTDYPDAGFLYAGTEILIEAARFFASVGFIGSDESFHIHGVTGPDEYTAIVNDNYFTNRMAKHALAQAAFWVRELADTETGNALAATTGVDGAEADTWADFASRMYLPVDPEHSIRPQDTTFLAKQRWTPAQGPRRPLLLEQHPLTIYRHQVLKQPDVVLADFLFEPEEDPDLLRRNFEYYDPLTSGDSSLSAAVQAAMAARLGYDEAALKHLSHALFTDLDNLHGNSADGIHVATAGSIWMAIVWAFAGIRTSVEGIRVDPRLPKRWASLRVPLRWRDTSVIVTITAETIVVANRGTVATRVAIDADGYHEVPANTEVQLTRT